MPETDPKALAEVAQIIVDACVGACTLEDLAMISPEEYADVMKAAMRITALAALTAEVEVLRAALAASKAEIERLKAELKVADEVREMCASSGGFWARRAETAEAQVERLREALRNTPEERARRALGDQRIGVSFETRAAFGGSDAKS